MAQGWLGGLKVSLTRAETTHQPRPDGAEIVDIPQGLDKLRRAIVSLQNEMVEAQAERATYIQAWETCKAEMTAAFSANTQRQHDAAHRIRRLQDEWVRASQDLGIRAEIVPSPVDDTQPE